MASEASILVVDDDPEILTLVKSLLERNGMIAHTAANAAEAERLLQREAISLMVLDLMMPGEDGLSFCKRIGMQSDTPILMLTAMSEDVDRIVGLEMGADDYLAKPFNPRELVARIRSILRRATKTANAQPAPQVTELLCFGSFSLDPQRRTLNQDDGQDLHLTSGEFALLLALVENAPRVLSRDQLLDLSRGAVANPFDRSIDSQISRIRRKIEPDPRKPQFIKTVRNLGYAFVGQIEKHVEQES